MRVMYKPYDCELSVSEVIDVEVMDSIDVPTDINVQISLDFPYVIKLSVLSDANDSGHVEVKACYIIMPTGDDTEGVLVDLLKTGYIDLSKYSKSTFYDPFDNSDDPAYIQLCRLSSLSEAELIEAIDPKYVR